MRDAAEANLIIAVSAVSMTGSLPAVLSPPGPAQLVRRRAPLSYQRGIAGHR